jgi:hypothetical protein
MMTKFKLNQIEAGSKRCVHRASRGEMAGFECMTSVEASAFPE